MMGDFNIKQTCSIEEENFARKLCPFNWQRILKSNIHSKSIKKYSTKANDQCLKSSKREKKCVLLRKKCIKNYFSKVTESGVNTNKEFWKVIKPFFTNKGFLSGNEITIIENDEVITGEKVLADKFINHYTNIAERSYGVRPTKLNLVNNSLN